MPKLGKLEERVEKRMEAMRKQDAGVGWYQDDAGRLYHFDGQVWDVIPEEITKRLEYLG